MPFSAAVQAVYATLKALREGVLPETKLASPELMKQMTCDGDFQKWMRAFLGR